MLRACLDCGTPSERARCPAHDAGGDTSWNGQRDRSTQRRFRDQTLEAAGHQCQAIEADGSRCTATDELQAHHLTPTAGAALCRRHHRLVDPHAR